VKFGVFFVIGVGVLCKENVEILARGSLATVDRCIQLSRDDP
jgi:hypothetical protein